MAKVKNKVDISRQPSPSVQDFIQITSLFHSLPSRESFRWAHA